MKKKLETTRLGWSLGFRGTLEKNMETIKLGFRCQGDNGKENGDYYNYCSIKGFCRDSIRDYMRGYTGVI